MYKSNTGLSIAKILYGMILSLILVLLMKIDVFKDLYDFSAIFFKNFQQQNMVFFGGVKQDLDFISNFGDLKTQNDQLKEENLKLISENSSLKSQINDNNLISHQITFDPGYLYIPIRITKYQENQTEVILNKGSIDNVVINDVLVYENFLFGYVIEVNNNYSIARLIIDPQVRIALVSQSSELKGVGFGDGINSVIMKQVPNETKLIMSEIILTSGTDGIFPYGLIIGSVNNINYEITGIEQSAQIIPAIKIKDMREIFIMKKVL